MQTQKVHFQAAVLLPRYGCVTSSGELADSNNPAHQGHIIGVTDGRVEATLWGDATVLGTLYEQTWAWTAGSPIYLNSTVLSQTAPGVGFVQQIGWALTGQSILVDLQAVGTTGPVGPAGPAGPPGPASVIIRDTWDPAPPAAAGVDTICVYRDGTASRTWDATFATWI